MTAFRRLLVLGGARSGKSRLAETQCEAIPGALTYIATAQAFDVEMSDRISHHRARRSARWHTVEAPIDLPAAIAGAHGSGAILVDCLTLWLSNLLLADEDIAGWTRALTAAVADCGPPILFVSNEVGLSIVPENALARRFRDESGLLNQHMANVCDRVLFVAAGLPLILKQDGQATISSK
jgi:adenosylcobinamide kinase / adenosylcobinamide-phosphate guanylyltransferase